MNEKNKALTLGEVRRQARVKGVRFFVWCAWNPDDGGYFAISKAEFFRTIGEMINDTQTTARISDNGDIYVN